MISFIICECGGTQRINRSEFIKRYRTVWQKPSGIWNLCGRLLGKLLIWNCGVIERQECRFLCTSSIWINRKIGSNFKCWKMDKISETPDITRLFAVCPIITHWSTRRTIPVAFILISPFCVKVWFCIRSISQFAQIMTKRTAVRNCGGVRCAKYLKIFGNRHSVSGKLVSDAYWFRTFGV